LGLFTAILVSRRLSLARPSDQLPLMSRTLYPLVRLDHWSWPVTARFMPSQMSASTRTLGSFPLTVPTHSSQPVRPSSAGGRALEGLSAANAADARLANSRAARTAESEPALPPLYRHKLIIIAPWPALTDCISLLHREWMQLPVEPIHVPASVVAATAAALIGATLGHPAACTIFADQLRGGAVPGELVALTTAGLSFLVVLRASGRGSGWAAVGSTVGFSIFAGGLNAGLACQFRALSEGHANLLAPFMLGSLLGIVFSAPLALAFAVAFAPLAALAGRARRAASHEATDLLLGYAGGAVAFCGALRIAWQLDSVGVVPVALGTLVAIFGFRRAKVRRDWILAVQAGSIPGFSIEFCDEAPSADLPCLIGNASSAVAALIRDPGPGAHYRVGESPRRLATLDLIGG